MGQRSIAEELTSQGYNALRFSHQTDANLIPAVEAAKKADIPGLNVNDAAIPPATNYVGNVPKGNGVHVAQWFIDNRPDGGQVAVIEGQSGVCAAGQCTAGFTETINASAS